MLETGIGIDQNVESVTLKQLFHILVTGYPIKGEYRATARRHDNKSTGARVSSDSRGNVIAGITKLDPPPVLNSQNVCRVIIIRQTLTQG